MFAIFYFIFLARRAYTLSCICCVHVQRAGGNAVGLLQ
jgi:hypothetical protein